ncbi:transcription factor FAMA-like [Curcuma longa]|uniref:transcription factor FAMA-like n=1 Tax=Curcuma longa TaxID=136217 RepID=UPI003D9E2DED
MTMPALTTSADLSMFFVHDASYASPLPAAPSSPSAFPFESLRVCPSSPPPALGPPRRAGATGKRSRRRTRVYKNKEEAENQRMTHIAVERNRRRQINEHLAMLRAMMPESYVQRGDQASIVGGAIDFIKELEQFLQSLEAQKRALRQYPTSKSARAQSYTNTSIRNSRGGGGSSSGTGDGLIADSPPFAQFFSFPQYSWLHAVHDQETRLSLPGLADIEVILVETHASVRILSAKRLGQLFKMVSGIQNLGLSVLHLSVTTTLDSMALYSLSIKTCSRDWKIAMCAKSCIRDLLMQVRIPTGEQEEGAISSDLAVWDWRRWRTDRVRCVKSSSDPAVLPCLLSSLKGCDWLECLLWIDVAKELGFLSFGVIPLLGVANLRR